MAVARSYLFNMSDKDILKVISNRTFAETKIYQNLYELVKELDTLPNDRLYQKIIAKFNFEASFITTGNISEHMVTIDSIGKIAENASVSLRITGF